jgi:hypothetical protein
MRKLDAAHLFVSPSLASGLFALLGSSLFLLIANSWVLQSDGFLTDLILGTNSSFGLIQAAEQTTFELSELTLGNPLLNKVLFFLFWMMVGLVVYAVLSTLGITIKDFANAAEDVHIVKTRKTHLDQSFWLKIAVRVSGSIALIFLYILSAKLIVPFSTLAGQAWLGSLDSFVGWFYGLLGFIVLALSLHILVIVLRLVFLKPRLFGGWDVFM